MAKKLGQKIKYQNRVYPVILRKETKGGYVVYNPAFEGCYSQGETIDEALENIKEATALCREEIENSTNEDESEVSVHLIHA